MDDKNKMVQLTKLIAAEIHSFSARFSDIVRDGMTDIQPNSDDTLMLQELVDAVGELDGYGRILEERVNRGR